MDRHPNAMGNTMDKGGSRRTGMDAGGQSGDKNFSLREGCGHPRMIANGPVVEGAGFEPA